MSYYKEPTVSLLTTTMSTTTSAIVSTTTQEMITTEMTEEPPDIFSQFRTQRLEEAGTTAQSEADREAREEEQKAPPGPKARKRRPKVRNQEETDEMKQEGTEAVNEHPIQGRVADNEIKVKYEQEEGQGGGTRGEEEGQGDKAEPIVPLRLGEGEEPAVYDLRPMKDLARVLNVHPTRSPTNAPWWWEFTVSTEKPMKYYAAEEFLEEEGEDPPPLRTVRPHVPPIKPHRPQLLPEVRPGRDRAYHHVPHPAGGRPHPRPIQRHTERKLPPKMVPNQVRMRENGARTPEWPERQHESQAWKPKLLPEQIEKDNPSKRSSTAEPRILLHEKVKQMTSRGEESVKTREEDIKEGVEETDRQHNENKWTEPTPLPTGTGL